MKKVLTTLAISAILGVLFFAMSLFFGIAFGLGVNIVGVW
jgi:hypothetical protein